MGAVIKRFDRRYLGCNYGNNSHIMRRNSRLRDIETNLTVVSSMKIFQKAFLF